VTLIVLGHGRPQDFAIQGTVNSEQRPEGPRRGGVLREGAATTPHQLGVLRERCISSHSGVWDRARRK